MVPTRAEGPPRVSWFSGLTYGAVCLTILLGGAAFVPGLARFVQVLFPLAATATAALLLRWSPDRYLLFMWWTWFLTPGLRRVVDYSVGYTEASPVMLTPFLVCFLALLPSLRNISQLQPRLRLPFGFAALSLAYAYCVGLLKHGLVASTFDLLNWSAPVILGLYLLTHHRHADSLLKATKRAFVWGTLFLGVYGACQFVFVPSWDAYWMLNADFRTIGEPSPYEVRVYSTLNSPVTLAVVLMTGLLLGFSGGGTVTWLATVAGVVTFSLTAVRSAWGGWLVGFLVLLARVPFRSRMRITATLLVVALVSVPLLVTERTAALLGERFGSLSELEGDTSFRARVALYTESFRYLDNPVGEGLGSTGSVTDLSRSGNTVRNLDSGLLAMVFTLGTLGSLYYISAAAILTTFAIVGWRTPRPGLTGAICVAILIAMLSQLAFSNLLSGLPGALLWFFPCLSLALAQTSHGNRKTHNGA